MRTGIAFQLLPEDRVRLERIAADRNTPQKHVWRAQIVLLSGDGVGTMEIMRCTGQSKPTVWRWQARFAAEGVDGLLRDKTRPPGKAPLAALVIQQVVTKTTTEKPHAAGSVRNSVCVRSVERHGQARALLKRWPNRTANWALAMAHSRAGILHSRSVLFKTR